MASEPRDRADESDLPDSLDEWLQGRAEATGASKRELLADLVSAYRVAVEGDEVAAEALADAMGMDERNDRLRRSLDERLDALEQRNEEALDDVRRRVVQLKEATKGKADADHTHPQLERLDELADTVESLQAAFDDLESTVEDHDDRLGTVVAELEDSREKLTQVASAVVKLRSAAPETDTGDGDPLLDIKREAARKDVERANCGACDEEVAVALLGEAACPHCGTEYAGIREASGFLKKPRLTGPGTDGEEP